MVYSYKKATHFVKIMHPFFHYFIFDAPFIKPTPINELVPVFNGADKVDPPITPIEATPNTVAAVISMNWLVKLFFFAILITS